MTKFSTTEYLNVKVYNPPITFHLKWSCSTCPSVTIVIAKCKFTLSVSRTSDINTEAKYQSTSGNDGDMAGPGQFALHPLDSNIMIMVSEPGTEFMMIPDISTGG